jgi:hypothetical protein
VEPQYVLGLKPAIDCDDKVDENQKKEEEVKNVENSDDSDSE